MNNCAKRLNLIINRPTFLVKRLVVAEVRAMFKGYIIVPG